jgi:hypothetical protein
VVLDALLATDFIPVDWRHKENASNAYDPKLSDRGARRGGCMAGGKAAVVR